MTTTLEAATQDLDALRLRPAALKRELDHIGEALAGGSLDALEAQHRAQALVAEAHLLPHKAAALARAQAIARMRFLLAEQSRLHAESAPLAIRLDTANEHGQAAVDIYGALSGQLAGVFDNPKSWPNGAERREEIRKLVEQAREAHIKLTQCQNERERLSRELREVWNCADAEDVEQAAAAAGEKARKEFADLVT